MTLVLTSVWDGHCDFSGVSVVSDDDEALTLVTRQDDWMQIVIPVVGTLRAVVFRTAFVVTCHCLFIVVERTQLVPNAWDATLCAIQVDHVVPFNVWCRALESNQHDSPFTLAGHSPECFSMVLDLNGKEGAHPLEMGLTRRARLDLPYHLNPFYHFSIKTYTDSVVHDPDVDECRTVDTWAHRAVDERIRTGHVGDRGQKFEVHDLSGLVRLHLEHRNVDRETVF